MNTGNTPASAIYSNSFLSQILKSLRMVAGPAYPRILEAAGLLQYRSELPPDNSELTASRDLVARLFSAGYTHLAPPQATLFFINMGEHLARHTWADPEVQALAGEVRDLPPAEQVGAAWSRLIELVNRDARVDRGLVTDQNNDYLVIENCPYCRDIHDAGRPVCIATARFYEVLLKELTGRPVIVREVECRATGQDRCMFAVRRERPVTNYR
ncbi:MAG TPA: V4R domain-containing protein [Chloroflexia bacterium]|nr:V4R domain-containing protein [Chloroflexia bacterium]